MIVSGDVKALMQEVTTTPGMLSGLLAKDGFRGA